MTDDPYVDPHGPGWEKEEAVDYDDYLDSLAEESAMVEVRMKDGSVVHMTAEALAELLDPPEDAAE